MHITNILIICLIMFAYLISIFYREKSIKDLLKISKFSFIVGVFFLIFALMLLNNGISFLYVFAGQFLLFLSIIVIFSLKSQLLYILSLTFVGISGLLYVLQLPQYSEKFTILFVCVLLIGLVKDIVFSKIGAYFLILMILANSYAFSQDPIDYYKDLFRSWSIPLRSTEETNTFTDEITYEIVFSSEFSSEYVGPIILICDTPIFMEEIQCDKREVSVQSTQDYIYRKSSSEFKEVIFVPESKLIEPASRDILSIYFRNISVSKNIEDEIINASGESKNANPSLSLNAAKKNVVNILSIIGVILLALVMVSPLVEFTQNGSKSLGSKNYLKAGLNQLLSFLEKRRNTFLAISLFTFFVLVTFLMFVSKHDIGQFSISYVFTYIVDSLNPKYVGQYIENLAYIRVVSVVMSYSIVFILFLLLFPRLLLALADFYKIIEKVEIPEKLLVGLVVALFNLVLATSFFINKSGVLNLFVLFSVFLLWVFFLLNKSERDLASTLTLSQKVISLVIVFGISIGGFVYQKYSANDIAMVNLFADENDLKVLPKKVDGKPGTRFNDFRYIGENPIVVDNYLVYYPDKTAVKNLPLTQFDLHDNFVIHSTSEDYLINALSKNNALLEVLSQEGVSNTFYIEDEKINEINEEMLTFRLNFDCKRDYIGEDISIVTMFSNQTQTTEIFNVVKYNEVFMHFPGCLKGETHSYIVNYELERLPLRKVFFNLSGQAIKDLTTMEILNEDEIVEIMYIRPINELGAYIQVSNSSANVIYSYADIPVPMLYDLSFDASGINVSKRINKLLDAGVISFPLYVWTVN